MSKKTIVGIIALIFVLIASSIYLFSKKNGKLAIPSGPVDYIIPGVPYVGVHSHAGEYSYVWGDTSSSLTSILEYWNPGKNNLTELRRFFQNYKKENSSSHYTGDSVYNYLDYAGGMYDIKREYLTIDELKKYINPQTRTPLFLTLSITPDQPEEVTFHPAIVLIGIKESERKLVFHHYWLGNNYEISYDDFNKLWDRMRPDERNSYLVIQPKNLNEKLAEINQRNTEAYPARTSIMVEAEDLFKNRAIGRGAFLLGLNDIALDNFNQILNSPKYEEYFPPFYKVAVLDDVAEIYIRKQDYETAKKYALKAVELNHDLDKPFKDWVGYQIRENTPDIIGKLVDPNRLLGEVYLGEKDYNAAVDQFSASLAIQPGNSDVAEKLMVAKAGQASGKLDNSKTGN